MRVCSSHASSELLPVPGAIPVLQKQRRTLDLKRQPIRRRRDASEFVETILDCDTEEAGRSDCKEMVRAESHEKMDFCLFCRTPVPLEKTKTNKSRAGAGSPSPHKLWTMSCSSSLRQVLELNDKERVERILTAASYCSSCLLLHRDIDFTHRGLRNFETRLKKSREKVESLLKSNFRLLKRDELNPRKSTATTSTPTYDLALRYVCEASAVLKTGSSSPKDQILECEEKMPDSDGEGPVIVSVRSTSGLGQKSQQPVQQYLPSKRRYAGACTSKRRRPLVTFQPLAIFCSPESSDSDN